MFDFVLIFKKHKRLIIGLVILFFAVGIFVFSSHGILTRLSLEMENSKVLDNITLELKLQDSLNKKINLLKNDVTEIERIAREHYGMVKQGEKIYFVKEKRKIEE
jgi:cell division protein FtsB